MPGKHDIRDAFLVALILVAPFIIFGCATKVIYVPQEEKAVRYELNGQKGWWLPDAVFAQLLEKAMRNQEKKP